MTKQAVILAGGKGTRLRERLGDLPKPLVDVCGVPLLERQLVLLKRQGFEHVLLLVNYQAEIIADYCSSRNNLGMKIQCIDDGDPRGTAGAVLQVWDALEDEFLIVYGDTMLEVDLARFQRYHAEDRHAAATLFLHPNDHPHDSDLVEMDEAGYVRRFHPYPHSDAVYLPNLVNAALYLMRKSALQAWRLAPAGIFDFGRDLFPAMLAHGLVLRGYNSPEYIKDCGTPQRIDKVSADWLSGKIGRAGLTHRQKAVFLDRDGTINVEVEHLQSPDQFNLIPGVGQAIRRLNLSEYRTCVVTNQPVIARGECTMTDLKGVHNKLETELGRQGAFVDRIYYCPHHPDSGFSGEVVALKMQCACRKPGTGMIDRAVRELNIELGASWLVGDTTTDLQTAHNAGLKSILVETGYAGLDHKFLQQPDFTVPDLTAAVDLILLHYPNALAQARPLVSSVKPGSVVLIGGQARSGKSSFASVVKDALYERGLRAHVISTDRWLLDSDKRGEGVVGRHALGELQHLFRLALDPAARPAILMLPAYRKLSKQHIPDAQEISIAPNDVLVFEGVIALALLNVDDATLHSRFFVQVEETERRRRMVHEYQLRGLSAKDAFEVYEERLRDEVPYIQKFSTEAHVISSSFSNETVSLQFTP